MPIRPIDTISMPNRSQEASQAHHAENQKQAHANEQLNVMYNNNIKQDSRQTVKMEKSENEEFRYKDGKNGNNNSSNGSKKKKKDKDEKVTEKKIKTSSFDMRI